MNRCIDSLGRIVIPKEIRKRLNIKENDILNIECKDNSIILTKEKKNDIDELKDKIKDWKISLEMDKNSVEGLNMFEEHTLLVLDAVLTMIKEIKKINIRRD